MLERLSLLPPESQKNATRMVQEAKQKQQTTKKHLYKQTVIDCLNDIERMMDRMIGR